MFKFKYLVLLMTVITQLSFAEQRVVESAKKYPYKNLIARAQLVTLFINDKHDEQYCNVEITLNKKVWKSDTTKIISDASTEALLEQCLPYESAKIMLSQTYVQFGQGL